MVKGFWGKKIGMAQVFSGNNVVPVTVVDTSSWFVLDIKTEERDGYNAVKVGRVRKRYEGQPFSPEWLKKLKAFFQTVREIESRGAVENIVVGQDADFYERFVEGALVDVSGITKGMGFAGVVKRHNFAGGPESHGSMFHRRPGTISHLRSCGKVIKGKKMPGHMGAEKQTTLNLPIVKIAKDQKVVLIKGALPGKAGSVVFVRDGVKA